MASLAVIDEHGPSNERVFNSRTFGPRVFMPALSCAVPACSSAAGRCRYGGAFKNPNEVAKVSQLSSR